MKLNLFWLGSNSQCFEYHNKLTPWEDFASGRAIHERYGKLARDISDPKIWQQIARDLSVGLIANIAIVQPDAVVVGGGVGSHFDKFGSFLRAEMKRYETPLIPIPPILPAKNSESAVIYGCYELAKHVYGHAA